MDSVKQFFITLPQHQRRVFFLLGIILFIALIPRIVLLYKISDDDFLHNDGREYMEISRQLSLGNGFSLSIYRWYEVPRPGQTNLLHADLSRSPMFPLLGAVPYFLPWNPILSEKGISLILSLLAIYCVFLLGNEFAGPLCGLVSAFLYSIDPFSLYFAASWCTENLFLIFLALAFFFLIRACKTRISVFPYCALFLALATLTRPNAFLLPPVFIALLAVVPPMAKRSWREFGRQTALFLAVFVLLLLPWTIRNYKVGGQFNPMTYYGSYVFYLSASEIIYESYRNMDTPEYTKKIGELWNRHHAERIAELRKKGVYGYGEGARYWKQWGLDYARKNPDKMTYILWQRFLHYFRMCPNLIALSPFQIFAFRAFFTVIFGFALTGLFLLRKQRETLILVSAPLFGLLVAIPFVFVLRYRYPFFVPYVSVLAAYAMAWLIGRLLEKNLPESLSSDHGK